MKILIINTGSWGTGSFTIINDTQKELIAMGHEVVVFFPDNDIFSSHTKSFYETSSNFKIWNFPIEKNGIKLEVYNIK